MSQGSENIIKWKRLKKISEKIAGRQVNIHGTTTLNNGILAATDMGEDIINIAINLNKIKSDNMVIEAIAHELAHICNASQQHDNEFHSKRQELEGYIKILYEGGY